jgi:hypothetical protein
MNWPTYRTVLFLGVLLTLSALSSTAQTLPSSEAQSVAGEKLVLATALHGQNFLLIMSFSREAGPGSDAWASALAADPVLHGIPVYRAAMLEAAPGFVRALIRSSLRHQLPPAEQSRYLIFSRDEKLWRDFLHLAADKQPVVALIGADGKMRWRGQGSTTELLPQLKAALR